MKILSTIKNIPSLMTRGGGRTMLLLQKYSPEILLGLGLAGGAATVVAACHATSKMSDIMDQHDLNTTNLALAENEALRAGASDDDLKEIQHEKTKTYLKTGCRVAKAYAPAVGFGAASVACILGSYGILHKRNVAVMAAYSVLNDRFLDYRQNVRDDLGDEADQRYLYGVHKETVEVEEIGKNGKKKKIKKEIDVVNPNGLSGYAVCFDESCMAWDRDPGYNKLFLTKQQNWANDKLRAQGHLFLNEVYDMLDIPRTKAGQVVGWVYDPNDSTRDSYVDFGIFNLANECSREFVNGYEKRIWLDFNVDGIIYDQI